MEDGAITFDFIWDCWKKHEYPEGFDDLLEKYLLLKADVFSGANVREVTSWLSKVLVATEIGILRDRPRFEKHKEYWRNVLVREWKVSVEDKWVVWA